MKIAVACDHGAFEYKEIVKEMLTEMGHEVEDLGCHGCESVDYPDYAGPAAQSVADGKNDKGIVICGISAGANALFEYGYSNIASDTFELVNGMGMIKGAFCPHYQKEERKSFDMVCRKQNLPAIGCADQRAYVVTDEKRFFLE